MAVRAIASPSRANRSARAIESRSMPVEGNGSVRHEAVLCLTGLPRRAPPYHPGVDLTRQWMSQSLRASGVSLAIPFAALVAAALVAAGGGGLDSLGQLTSGPAPPTSLDQFAGDQSATAEAS